MSTDNDGHIQRVRLYATIAVTFIVLIGGFVVIFIPGIDDGTKKVVIGFVGAAIGYWLK